ncbi:hypothetical protein PIB30_092537 [Stylosanthes scabra]|uniref:Uncharacterized protein n=1 Tax=Stylosanthes scabra TaxID=79078 RepID=A0ABU6SVA7_9FABA|nr:hypothetical protein [Stylosanthes scabra]
MAKVSCPSVLSIVESSLTLLKSLSKSLSGITSRFCLFLEGGLSGLMTKVRPFLGCTRILSLLKDIEKQSRFDRLMQKMKEVEGAGPRSILPCSKAQAAASGASTSVPVAPASTPAASVHLALSSGAVKAKKKPLVSSSGKPFSVEREEGIKEDPSAD